MEESLDGQSPGRFRLKSGAVVRAGWMERDLPFLTRSLRFLIRADSDALRQKAGLELGEIGVLGIVSHNPGISQNDLATSLVLKKSAVTKLVQRLETRGMIARRRSQSDRRSNELSLTPAGTATAEKLRGLAQQLHDEWFRDIPPGEREVFFSVLFRLVASMAERGGDDAQRPDPDED